MQKPKNKTHLNTMEENEKNKLYEKIKTEIGEDFDLFDIKAEIDSNLTYEENLRIIREKINILFEHNIKNTSKENDLRTKEFIQNEKDKYKEPVNKLYTEQNNFLIIGKKGSGKTSLGWSFAEKIQKESNRKIYVYNHPRSDLLKTIPFEVNNLIKLEQVYTLTDAVVLFDEAQLVFNVLDKKVNNKFKNLLSISRQNNVSFIFICHNSYFINRSLFSFIDVKIIKEVNEGHFELERKHIQKLYEDVIVFGKENFYIDSDYIKGLQTFNKPEWFNDSLSYSYRNFKKCDFFK